MYKLFMRNIEKKYEFNLTLKNAVLKNEGKVKIVLKIYRNLQKEKNGPSQRKQNRSGNISEKGRFYKRFL